LDDGYYQIGTLGGGNHFIELQEDQGGMLCIMIHSGSRHLGAGICAYFHQIAREKAAQWGSTVPDDFGLAYLPTDSSDGQQYIQWMNLALDYAYENRQRMMRQVCDSTKRKIEKFTGQTVVFEPVIDCHHNYASQEQHFGETVWVHRKGAISARKGERAVIPGAMGAYSYVVEGKGCEEAMCSASHGAGRKYSRAKANEIFTVEQVVVDLKQQGVILGKRNKNDVTEECRQAYKDIDEVLAQEANLVTPIRKLRTVGVVKG
jgi:tRNA-splicing ligase RtcB